LLLCLVLAVLLPLSPVAAQNQVMVSERGSGGSKRTTTTVPVQIKVTTGAVHFFVAPNGSRYGDGSFTRPWDLATALAHPKTVLPGDTIWLRAGTYRGAFYSRLTGTKASPIVVRQYPGERSVLDSNGSGNTPTLAVYGAWTTYWGFEIMNSYTQRVIPTGTSYGRGNGVQIMAPGSKFINMIVHDTLQGFGFWSEAPDAELYGNLAFFNGYVGPHQTHGIYAQNRSGIKRILDNITFQNFSHGIHAYSGAAGYLNNLYVEGNISFNNGYAGGRPARNLLVGGYGVTALSPTVHANYTYYPLEESRGENNLGYYGGCQNLTLHGNHFVGGARALVINKCAPTTATGNVVRGTSVGVPATAVTAAAATGAQVFVRRNVYEPGRAHIAVYNWARQDEVEVDIADILPLGTTYEVRNAQDYFGPPVLTGTYDGQPLRLPMTNLKIGRPVGAPYALATAGPTFGAFVLIGTMPRPTVLTNSPARQSPVAR
jgi:hypothetical protein